MVTAAEESNQLSRSPRLDAAEQPQEPSAKAVRQKGVEKGIDTAVQISQAVSDDVHADHQRRADHITEVLCDEDDVNRQPADRENKHYDDDHTRHATTISHPFGGFPPRPRQSATGQPAENATVQGADDRQGKQVGEGEEATVDDASVLALGLLVLGEDASVETLGARLAGVVVVAWFVLPPDVKVADTDDEPVDGDRQARVALCPDGDRSDRVDDSQEAIQGHKDESVDAGVGSDVGHVLVDLTPGGAEGPDGESVAGGGERDADDDEEKIGDGKTDDEHVRHVLRLTMVDGDNDDDDEVADNAEESNDAEGRRNEDGGQRLEVFVFR